VATTCNAGDAASMYFPFTPDVFMSLYYIGANKDAVPFLIPSGTISIATGSLSCALPARTAAPANPTPPPANNVATIIPVGVVPALTKSIFDPAAPLVITALSTTWTLTVGGMASVAGAQVTGAAEEVREIGGGNPGAANAIMSYLSVVSSVSAEQAELGSVTASAEVTIATAPNAGVRRVVSVEMWLLASVVIGLLAFL
jgi:hypothetical protein